VGRRGGREEGPPRGGGGHKVTRGQGDEEGRRRPHIWREHRLSDSQQQQRLTACGAKGILGKRVSVCDVRAVVKLCVNAAIFVCGE